MYLRPYALLLGLLWPVAPAVAQPKPSPQNIAYRRDIPKYVAHAIPRRAKRLFWGTLTPQEGTPVIGLQLYQSNGSLTLELWQKKANRFVRINRLPGIYDQSVFPSSKFNAKFYWVDNARKTTPVLVITQTTSGSDNLMGGLYQQIKVVAFPAGWNGKSSAQTFFDGSSNSGDDIFSIGYNDRGRLELTTVSGDFSGSSTDTYAWDGQEFSIVPEMHKSELR